MLLLARTSFGCCRRIFNVFGSRNTGLLLMLILGISAATHVSAFSEFQSFSQEISKQPVNCAQCHLNPDGPVGAGPGQIGSITGEGLDRLNEGRAALPGQEVNSPIMNEFGNLMITKIGAEKLTELRKKPGELAAALDQTSDLDMDSITDVNEFLGGTDPMDRMSGNPKQLFLHNLAIHKLLIFTVGFALALLLYGFRCLLLGYEAKNNPKSEKRAIKPPSCC